MLSPHVDVPSNKYGKRALSLNVDADDVVSSSSVKDLWAQLPACNIRKHILATDGLASVDGFRAMVLLAYGHLSGLVMRGNCPDYNRGGNSSRVNMCLEVTRKQKAELLDASMPGTRLLMPKFTQAAFTLIRCFVVQCSHSTCRCLGFCNCCAQADKA